MQVVLAISKQITTVQYEIDHQLLLQARGCQKTRPEGHTDDVFLARRPLPKDYTILELRFYHFKTVCMLKITM